MNNAEGQFIQRITNGENIHKVYKEVFMADTSKANSMIQEPEIRESIIERLKSQGITENKIHRTLKKQLDAKKVIYYDPRLSKDIVDDNEAQLKAVTTGYKLMGLLKDKDIYIDNRQVTFSADPKVLEGIVLEMQKLKADAIVDTTGEVI